MIAARTPRLGGLALAITLAGFVAASQVATAADAAASDASVAMSDYVPDLLDNAATPKELNLANSWVPNQRELQFGAEPLGYVQDAAATAAGNASCTISDQAATALVIAMTWPEVSPGGTSPSPMTLSRWDTQPSLGDPENRAEGLWFHPGIGMWQLDSAGLGATFTAGEAMDSQHAADQMAPFIVGKYCASRNAGEPPADARAHAWTDWVACRQGACEDVYQRILSEGVNPAEGVDRHGGADVRRCWYAGAAHDCVFVDVANAQGSTWWANPGGGPSPVAAPFYVIRLDGAPPTELRYWLAVDSGAATDVQATRPFGANARGGLTWSTSPSLCDLTEWRGDC
jgi:hypothetical protein